MKNKSLVGLLVGGAVLGMSTTALASTTPSGTYVKEQHRMSYETAKKQSGKTYKLAFLENRASNDSDDAYYTLGYYSGGKIKTVNFDTSEANSFIEVIDPNLKTPFVQIKTHKHEMGVAYYIHRPPYNMYNQPTMKGHVTAKQD